MRRSTKRRTTSSRNRRRRPSCLLSRWSERPDNGAAAKDFSVQFFFVYNTIVASDPPTMAKGKGKRPSGANEAVAESGDSVAEPQATPNMPQIDENAFAGLRQKIEQRLKNEGPGKGKSKKEGKPQASADNAPPKKDKGAGPKAGRNQDPVQGKKRDRNGDVIAREEKQGGKAKQSKPESSKDSNNDPLRQEILALGGTEEDLDLLAGVDSESEVEGAPSKGKKGGEDELRKELSKMLEAAGHVVPDDLEDEEAEQSEEDEEEAGDDSRVSEEGSEETSEPEDESDISDIEEAPPSEDSKANAIKSKESEAVVPKEYAKLVSRIPSEAKATN